jgi:hypothetical protein
MRYPHDLDKSNLPFVTFDIVKFRQRNFVRDGKVTALNSVSDLYTQPNTAIIASDKITPLSFVALPLPTELSNSYNPQWEVSDQQLVSALSDYLNNNDKSQIEAFGPTIASVLFGGIAKLGGKTPNPKKQAIFNGIDARSFSFNYSFTPRSLKEANTLEAIIKELTEYSLPSLTNASDAFFDFPAEFLIRFHNVQGFPIYDYCVCTGITTNYTPQSMQLLSSGHSVQINLTLNFLETSLRTKESPGI